MSLVFFDFDGTLTTRDTILPLGLALARTAPNRYSKVCFMALYLGMLKLRIITNHGFKERFCALLLKGRPKEEVARVASIFIRDYVRRVFKRPIVEALIEHTRRGDEVYLVSSNFSFALSPLQDIWPLRGVVCTEAECLDGRFTGRVVGRSCDGEEKLERVVNLFGEGRIKSATAYGDSRSDHHLLDFVSQAVWV